MNFPSLADHGIGIGKYRINSKIHYSNLGLTKVPYKCVSTQPLMNNYIRNINWDYYYTLNGTILEKRSYSNELISSVTIPSAPSGYNFPANQYVSGAGEGFFIDSSGNIFVVYRNSPIVIKSG